VRLYLAQFRWTDALQALESVGFAALVECFEAGYFIGRSGDDNFAADIMRDTFLAAEGDHGGGALNAEARLQRSRLVVEAGMDDTAVVAARVAAHVVLFLHDGETETGMAQKQFPGDGEPDHSAPYDRDVDVLHEAISSPVTGKHGGRGAGKGAFRARHVR
jgi:hypothetical protein